MHQTVNDSIIPGTLLVAHPELESPFFKKSVVLITEMHEGGTVGFCLNRSSGHDMASVLSQNGVVWNFDDMLYIGGPVHATALCMLHTSEWTSTNTIQVTEDLSLTSDNLMTEKMNMGDIPRQYRFVNGMSGWAPLQLEEEIVKHKSWLTCEASEDIVFYNSEQQWRKSIDLCASRLINQYI